MGLLPATSSLLFDKCLTMPTVIVAKGHNIGLKPLSNRVLFDDKRVSLLQHALALIVVAIL